MTLVRPRPEGLGTKWVAEMPMYSLRTVLQAQDAAQLASDAAQALEVRVLCTQNRI